MKSIVYIENEAQLRSKIDKLKKELIVNKSELSSSVRKKTSAADSRRSATIIGSTLSIPIIVLVIALVTVGDVVRLFILFKQKVVNIVTQGHKNQ